ncbi:hypothetical protein PROFUN_06537 [Planoprotostelium fungivorum]|uniref:Uncharacterized protein n=1 Tax=Planoprotostelium fungivorum TaxID=1890364 RepID=A0A2P6NP19_9EUKA|nr:hypothetical protein PROFUN_06537 [Planoprotostelium fungivorum]
MSVGKGFRGNYRACERTTGRFTRGSFHLLFSLRFARGLLLTELLSRHKLRREQEMRTGYISCFSQQISMRLPMDLDGTSCESITTYLMVSSTWHTMASGLLVPENANKKELTAVGEFSRPLSLSVESTQSITGGMLISAQPRAVFEEALFIS